MRRRYRYDEVMRAVIEVGLVRDTPKPRVHIQTGAHYEGLRATDGTPVNTSKRHRQYMKDHNVALYEDYEKTFTDRQEAKEREAMGLGGRDIGLAEDLNSAYEKVRAGYKPPSRPEVDEDKAAVVRSYIVGKDI
jgi:hypothetical protein